MSDQPAAGDDPAPQATGRSPRLAVLISGRGSNLKAILDACARHEIPAQVALVISNRADAGGLDFAQAAGVPSQVISHREFPTREAFDAAIALALRAAEIDVIALAGFMRILTADFINEFAGRLVNIHPSLLPAFRGLDTHARVLAAGDREHGASVHFVTEELDSGPVVMQARVPVCPGDDPERLAARVHQAEHRLYPQTLALILSGRVKVAEDVVFLDGTPLTQPLLIDSLPETTSRCPD